MSDSPTLGRWLEQDPERYIDGANLYQAFLDNPVGYVDPSGLSSATQPATQPSTTKTYQPGVRINTRRGWHGWFIFRVPINHAWIECVGNDGKKQTISGYPDPNDESKITTMIDTEIKDWDYNTEVTDSVELPVPAGKTLAEYIEALMTAARNLPPKSYDVWGSGGGENCTSRICKIVGAAGGTVPPFDPGGFDDFKPITPLYGAGGGAFTK